MMRYVLGKHAGPVIALAYHPRGDSVASVGEDGTVYLWRFSARRETVFGDRPGRASALAYSPDGRYLAAGVVGAGGSTVPLLDLESGELRLDLNAPNAWISTLAASPDGARIAAGTKDGALLVWEVERLLERQPGFATIEDRPKVVEVGDDIITSAAFSVAGDCLVAGSLGRVEGHRWVWNVPEGRFDALTVPEQLQDVRTVAYDPTGQRLACGSDDGSLCVWDLTAEGAPPLTIPSQSGESVHAMVFSHDGARLLAGGTDDVIRVWDARTGADEGSFAPESGGVLALALSPDGDSLVSGHRDGTVLFWEHMAGKQ